MTAKPSDWAARQEALDPSRSFIVQAPAGSGKTELLIQRILVLLARVQVPEEVLAITFTRKAAGEMRTRLLCALQQADAAPEPDEEHSRTTWRLAVRVLTNDRARSWNLLANPNRLQVMTIDSLCASLTRRMPWLSAFGSQPETTASPNELYTLAAERLLEQVERNGPGSRAARRLLRHLDNQLWTLRDLLVDMLGRRDQWLRHLLDHPANPRDILEEGLRAYIEGALKVTCDCMNEELRNELQILCRYASGHAEGPGQDAGEVSSQLFDGFPQPIVEQWPAWQVLLDLLLTKQGKVRASVNRNQGFPPGSGDPAEMKQRMIRVLEQVAGSTALVEHLGMLREMPHRSYATGEWRVLEGLIDLLPLAVVELQKTFRDHGTVDFIEVAGAARAALGSVMSPEELMLQLDSRISHILIDEFQDTSHGQYVLLEQLTAGWSAPDGRTLFVVGDPMQSIYRFREADVGLYLKARRAGLPNVSLESLTLEANFRSQQQIISWVNQVFRGLFSSDPDETTGAVTYAPASAVRPALEGEAVTLTAFADRQDELEAARVVELVRHAQSEDPESTVAVLVRTRTHLDEIVRAFKKNGLSFQAQEIDPLDQRPVIQDLRALTRAILHPGDRVAWLSILRAPWCGLRLNDLLRICERSAEESVWKLLRNPARQDDLFDRHGSESRQRIAAFCDVMQATLEQRGRVPLRRLLEACWLSLGGPACTTTSDLQDVSRFFDLLEELDVGGSLPSLEKLDEHLVRLYALPDAGAGPSLQVMTMHKAKGLEFDVVILPGLGRPPQFGQRTLLRWQETPDNHLLLAPIPALDGKDEGQTYHAVGRLMRIKDDHEALRLFYVAATRAKQRLHLIGHVKEKADGGYGAAKGSLFDSAWDSLADPIQRNLILEEMTAPVCPETSHGFRRLPVAWRMPPWPVAIGRERPQERIASVLQSRVSPPSSLTTRTEEGRLVGTVTHAWLERIAEEGLEMWPMSRLPEMQREFSRQLLIAGVPAHRVEECTVKVQAALQNSLSSDRGRWLLDEHQEAASELALSGIVEGELVHATIDRTFVDEAGLRWVVDYKTSEPKNCSLDDFLIEEEARYQPQLAAYVCLFRVLEPARDVRAALYFPVIDGWQECRI